MNVTLCDFCKPLFEGKVLDEEQVKAQMQRPFEHARQHHDSVRDLVDCGQTRCLLCAALWASVLPQQTKNKWLEADRMQQSYPKIFVAATLGPMVIAPDESRPVFTLTIEFQSIQLPREGKLTFYSTLKPCCDFLGLHQRLICIVICGRGAG